MIQPCRGLNESLILTGTGPASTDVITFTAGNDITLTDDGAGNGFTIASTASGDTYTLAAGTKAGTSVPLNLDAAAGTDSTVSLTEAKKFQILSKMFVFSLFSKLCPLHTSIIIVCKS